MRKMAAGLVRWSLPIVGAIARIISAPSSGLPIRMLAKDKTNACFNNKKIMAVHLQPDCSITPTLRQTMPLDFRLAYCHQIMITFTMNFGSEFDAVQEIGSVTGVRFGRMRVFSNAL